MSMLLTALLMLPQGPPILRTCAPPPALCQDLEEDCIDAGLDVERCAVLSEGICPADRCTACEQAVGDCKTEGLDCSELEQLCAVGLGGCSCTRTCEPAAALALPELLAVCFAYPWALGDDCKAPSAGQCFAILTLDRDLCDLSTCEYIECMEDLAEQNACGKPPPSCWPLLACDAAEQRCA